MQMKIVLCVALAVLAIAEARTVGKTRHQVQQSDDDYSAEDGFEQISNRQPHPALRRAVPHTVHKQARVFPGALAIKKLVLLKFKKIVPISLILLKSSNENEAELVPVYPTSEIPANVQFIPTPNGISGHKDVQAIAIPSELHEQLEANGLANLEHIEALLNQASEVPSDDDNTVSIVGAMNADEPLNVSETDVNQLLEGAVAAAPEESKPVAKPLAVSTTGTRRLAADEFGRPVNHNLKTAHQTTVEEIPLFLYSAKDGPVLHNNARVAGLRLATSNGAVRRTLH